ncbi:ATP-binding cassette sub-family G member 4 isoform X2 [Diaphorina citri]|uniref:ATP-binding cassette sub-family G member 4 isoform X1 n=1 Tax=Diaphorina citri TaxID=121845 RepID=A0A1S4EBY9_DIACI|nr:ATP-binding cassette sub-family G member 4 isoform X2 [Diaphorina citri]XP_026679717.1 ATP-binding cassette sub-family G member 4 isoform X1 [Diaphorina citri]XP_026679718.1 ATP-binding cassette sub-family G member 4 isoform X2 [Diaphorina citri]XP_026679720.1 ATP-binding cassette sub-family G member 4 isoform X2 [Diaphorina citri]XP_026679721.1 ATP-binding cassette sub-family G member 4 isoform X2 [Diaphorina citri]
MAQVEFELSNSLSSSESGTSLETADRIEIKFKDLTYTVSTGLGFKQEPKDVLKNLCGRFPSNQLIAIMGPSGAGKSSLLDVLSGYRSNGVTGQILTNGHSRNINAFRRVSCYIQQDDRLQPLLTVRESMDSAADFKLGHRVSKEERSKIIENVMSLLGLDESQNTRSSQLSGGQKKRLSIALELINNPRVMFLDEPTTGLDSQSCSQCIKLLKMISQQGRTIICTIHQPSATLFQMFDQVYLLSGGQCLYQGATDQLVNYLSSVNLPCPKYHNPADFVIELASGEYGVDNINAMVEQAQNGKSTQWFDKSYIMYPSTDSINNNVKPDKKTKKTKHCTYSNQILQDTSYSNQLGVLLSRGLLKVKRDSTLTHLRIIVNIFVALMLGVLFQNSGEYASSVLINYNLLFSILIHHVMTSMMLNILTFPMEMSILIKEHFNRWYSLKAYYVSVNLLDIPVAGFCCLLFTTIVYPLTGQPMELTRFTMFNCTSLLVVFIAQSVGYMVGAVFNVVNGTFVGPVLVVPMMMFSGFGVSINDIPKYMRWGSELSYLRYGLEGYVAAIYGLDRKTLQCDELYCHYKEPKKFLQTVSQPSDNFWSSSVTLVFILIVMKLIAYFFLSWRIKVMR